MKERYAPDRILKCLYWSVACTVAIVILIMFIASWFTGSVHGIIGIIGFGAGSMYAVSIGRIIEGHKESMEMKRHERKNRSV